MFDLIDNALDVLDVVDLVDALSQSDMARVVELYSQGYAASEISRATGIDLSLVRIAMRNL